MRFRGGSLHIIRDRPTITDGVHTESAQYTVCLVRTQGMY